jgi:hypothetical protein
MGHFTVIGADQNAVLKAGLAACETIGIAHRNYGLSDWPLEATDPPLSE